MIAPSVDHLERGADAAKYRRISDEPYLEAVIPSLSDPTLAPEGRHVMSVLVQWAPYRLGDGDWEKEREGLGDLVLKTLEAYAPGLSGLVTARQVLTPLDLERDFGLTGGHVLHGEPGPRPVLRLAAAARLRAVPDAGGAACTCAGRAPTRAAGSPAHPARTPPARSCPTSRPAAR